MRSEHQFALLVRLSMTKRFLEQLAKFCSNHDPVLVVSLAGRTIQDAKKFEQWVDLLHLFQTPDVRVPPSDRTSLGIGVGGIGGWLDVLVVVMIDGVIIDVGKGRGVTEDEAFVKIDSIPGSIIRFNKLVTNDDVDELSC
nr:hypothetical protein [Tanacetum cinerariifolium]